MADPEEERLGLEPEDSGGMDPDHPLLARAQAALKAQLVTARENVEAELRAKHESLRVRDLSGDARRCARLADRPAPPSRGPPPPPERSARQSFRRPPWRRPVPQGRLSRPPLRMRSRPWHAHGATTGHAPCRPCMPAPAPSRQEACEGQASGVRAGRTGGVRLARGAQQLDRSDHVQWG